MKKGLGIRYQGLGKRRDGIAKALVVVFLSAGLLAPDPCSLIPAATAASISSSKINTFMHLPDWMPTSVDETHTFGSDEHTNATRRTTFDTIAAVESIFDAYHERTFFMSEGRSNNWNVAKYGPRPANEAALVDILFTNEYRNAQNSFVYKYLLEPATNSQGVVTNAPAHPREVYDTRRLVEFPNVFNLVEWMPWEFFYGPNSGQRTIPMPVVPTWIGGYAGFGDRPLYVGSSWMPGKLYPQPFGWSSPFPTLNLYDFTNSCLPVYECTPDEAFRKGGYWYSQETVGEHYDSNYLHARFIRPATFGDLDEWTPYVGNYWTTFSESRPWVRETVSDVIRTKFPNASPEAGMTNLTRRLVKDDFLTYDVTFEEQLVGSDTVTLDLEAVRPNDTPFSGEPWINHYFGRMSEYDVDWSSNVLTSVTLVSPPPEETWYADDVITWSGTEIIQVNYDYDRVSVFLNGGAPEGYVEERWYDGELVWQWISSSAEIGFNFYKTVAVTNAVYTNSSVIATASRALAMLDRTYEIPENSFRGVITSNELSEARAEVQVSGVGPVPDGEVGEWELVSPTSARLPVAETEEDVVVSMGQTGVERSFETKLTGANYSTTAKYRFSGIHTSTRRIYYLPMEFPVAEYEDEPPGVPPATDSDFLYELLMDAPGSFSIRSTGVQTHETFVRAFHFVPGEKTPYISVSTVLYQNAALETTTPARRGGVDLAYPHYGPGSLAFGSGRVGDCRCTILAGIMKLVGRRDGDGYFDLGDWANIDHDLSWTTDRDTLKYNRGLLYSAHGDEVTRNSDVVSLVTGALNNGWARGKLHEVCEAEIGGRFGPTFLQPSFTRLVINHENIAKYNGGHYYVQIPTTGYLRWPLEPLIVFGFAVNAKGEAIELDKDEAFTAPVSADLHVSSPLISTQWNWKSLKSERNDQ